MQLAVGRGPNANLSAFKKKHFPTALDIYQDKVDNSAIRNWNNALKKEDF